jgi:hypothetical protein
MNNRTNQDEHENDPLDRAEGLYILDGRFVEVVDVDLPYPEHEEAPESMRNYRPAMTRRWREG